jgi:hypothetical protein
MISLWGQPFADYVWDEEDVPKFTFYGKYKILEETQDASIKNALRVYDLLNKWKPGDSEQQTSRIEGRRKGLSQPGKLVAKRTPAQF